MTVNLPAVGDVGWGPTINDAIETLDGRLDAYAGDAVETTEALVTQVLTDPTSGPSQTIDSTIDSKIAEANTAKVAVTLVEKYLSPSGDASGVTDLANINAILAVPFTKMILDPNGLYMVNDSVLQGSYTDVDGRWATIKMLDGLSKNVWRNSDQRAIPTAVGTSLTGYGNDQLSVRRLKIVGAAATGTELAGRGFFLQNVRGWRAKDLVIGPTSKMAAIQYGVIDGYWDDITLAQDRLQPNQDGIDMGPGCRNIHINRVRGKTGDDLFSIFAKNTGSALDVGGNTTAYSTSLRKRDELTGSRLADIGDIYIDDVEVDVAISVVRCQAGDGIRLSRVFGTSFKNLRRTSGLASGTPIGVLQMGNTSYVTTPPAPEDMSDIFLDGYIGPASYLINAESNFTRVGVSNATITAPDDSSTQGLRALIGCLGLVSGFTPTASEISISNVHIAKSQTDTYAGAAVFDVPTGSAISQVTIDKVHGPIAAICKGAGGISGLLITAVHVTMALGTLFQQTGRSTGLIGKVTVDQRASGVSNTYGSTPLGLKFASDMPPFRSGDTPPEPILGSIVMTDGTVNPAGDGISAPGMFVGSSTAWNRVGSLNPDVVAPTIPGVPAAVAQAKSIVVSWGASTDSSGVAGYRIFRSDAPNTVLAATPSTSYADESAAVGTAYTYRVTAYDAAGNESAKSSASNAATADGVLANWTDTFNRADSSAGPGSNWTTYGTTTLSMYPIISNMLGYLRAGTTAGTNYLAAITPFRTRRQATWALIAAVSPTSSSPHPSVMAMGDPNGGSPNAYSARYGAGAWHIYKTTAGTGAELGVGFTEAAPSVPYYIQIEVDGQLIRVLAGASLGTLVEKYRYLDPTPFTVARQGGIISRFVGDPTNDNQQRIDSFGLLDLA